MSTTQTWLAEAREAASRLGRPPGGPQDAAEAWADALRTAFLRLDAALCRGEELPVSWQREPPWKAPQPRKPTRKRRRVKAKPRVCKRAKPKRKPRACKQRVCGTCSSDFKPEGRERTCARCKRLIANFNPCAGVCS